ncbi:MAG: ScyD/ScyE family protein [Salinivenus sp.]
MRRLIAAFTLLLSVGLLITACDSGFTGSNDTPEERLGEESSRSKHQIAPHSVLSGRNSAGLLGVKKNHAPGPPAANGNGFQTPLFGLATAPNGDILVADAGAGVATLSGATDIPLPGITDMSPLGRGTMWATEGLTGEPGEDTGQGLYRASKGKNRLIADLFAFEENQNPDGAEFIDSNPFDVQSLGGQAALVADAGGNDLLRIDNQGNIEVLAVFPDEPVPTANIKSLFGCPEGPPSICKELPEMLPAQAVPTSIAVGPDGYYYVGELKGFPAPTGASNIWKVAPDASGATCPSPNCQKVFDGGFTSVIDLRFDESGTLHVLELEENSWFALELDPPQIAGGTINACDPGAGTCSEVATGIPILTAITFGTDGTLWATKNALIPDQADVVEVP